MCNPAVSQVVVGILAVFGGCLIAAVAIYAARANRNPIHLITALGASLFVIGVVGQRAYQPTQDLFMQAACPASVSHGAWSASIALPVLGVALDAIALAGVVIAVLGICAALLIERTGEVRDDTAPRGNSLEEGDAV